jgi:hypothetical protein
MMVAAGMVLGLVAGLLARPIMMNGSIVIGMLVMTLLVQLPLMFVGFRLATSLPGMALGETHRFMSGWEATKGDWRAILELSVIMALALWLINMIGFYLFGGMTLLAHIWQLLSGWPVMMVGLSVLTTLYGHYIEKRPLV